MAHFLRDQRISSVSITEDRLSQLSTIFEDREKSLDDTSKANNSPDDEPALSYIIRFDGKGYRVFSIDELLRYFHQAKSVERVLITLETGRSLKNNRQTGTFMEVRLDEVEPHTSYLQATSDDKDWAEAAFSSLQEVIYKCNNKSAWVRSAWTTFIVQLVGVTLGFLLSLWAAAKFSPKLAVESPFVISFIFVFILFSNTWTYLNQLILRILNLAFPNVKFIRKGREHFHWLFQAIVGGLVGAVVLYFLSQAGAFLLDVLSSLVAKNA
ncbi:MULTISPECIES: hypothetical protein [unclassified Thiobacillus]|uniref:hypothetical protein n=1 Tax=unclassified Thiobacillus TaxID=2646513 RepID=UPI00086F1BC0|nr:MULTISPECIES: hypothetical protein [unclassified Thiobacillus]MBN8779802.1 CvpA family protein [Thiobacillus sp.]ODV03207.1 MAG: hypothetical protein ABT23_04500 [Thiobacillus sp. SCN 63-57]